MQENEKELNLVAELIFRGGCDLTTNNPTLMEIQSCMASRYDAGICKHRKEHTGVIEVWKLKK